MAAGNPALLPSAPQGRYSRARGEAPGSTLCRSPASFSSPWLSYLIWPPSAGTDVHSATLSFGKSCRPLIV